MNEINLLSEVTIPTATASIVSLPTGGSPATSPSAIPSSTASKKCFRVAIIGAGPAGIYTSDILIRQLQEHAAELHIPSDISIDIFEKLPAPFGLVRYGVAPDHPFIKLISEALEKALDNPHIHLFCNVNFGTDITLNDILPHYDAIIITTGASGDKHHLFSDVSAQGIYGASSFVKWYEGYPGAQKEWDLSAQHVAVIGGGNVAMDISRLLVKDPQLLRKTEIPSTVEKQLESNQLKTLHIFVRRSIAYAKFAVAELRELEKLDNVEMIIHPDDLVIDPQTAQKANEDKLTRQMLEELQIIAHKSEENEKTESTTTKRKIIFHFNSNPVKITTKDNKVTSICCERTQTNPQGMMQGTGEYFDIPVEAVYTAIGYLADRVSDIPYDEKTSTVSNKEGRVVNIISQEIIPKIYTAGWAKRGCVGLIGSTKSDGQQVVAHILEDWAYLYGSSDNEKVGGENTQNNNKMTQNKMTQNNKTAKNAEFNENNNKTINDEFNIRDLLKARHIPFTDLDGWHRLDHYEQEQGALCGKDRLKIVDSQQMRDISRGSN